MTCSCKIILFFLNNELYKLYKTFILLLYSIPSERVWKIKKAKSKGPAHKNDGEDDATAHNLNPNGCVPRQTSGTHAMRAQLAGIAVSWSARVPTPFLLFFFPDPGHGGGVRFTCAHLPNPPSDAVFINAFRVLSIFYRAFCSMTWVCSVPSGRTISIASGRCSFIFFYPFQSASDVA